MGRLKFVPILLLSTFALTFACSSNEEKKVSYLEKGTAYFEKGEYKSAELEFKNALQIDPQYIEAYTKLGETQLKLGNPQEAFRAYSMVAKLDPKNSDAQLKLATFYLLGKKIKEAREKVDAVLSKEPKNIEALFLQVSWKWKKSLMKHRWYLKKSSNSTGNRPVHISSCPECWYVMEKLLKQKKF